MADISINQNCKSNSKNFPKTQASISWHGAQSCTVTFGPSTNNCFGDVASITLPPDQTLDVVSDVTTTFTPSGCPEMDTYEITFGSPEESY
jgi:hypothetical protein